MFRFSLCGHQQPLQEDHILERRDRRIDGEPVRGVPPTSARASASPSRNTSSMPASATRAISFSSARSLECEFYGYSVIDFDIVKDADGQFQKVNLLPREHYRPEDDRFLKTVHEFDGIPMDTIRDLGFKVLTLGSKTDLGLLALASFLVIEKTFTWSDWSVRNEKFGMPFVFMNTEATSKKELTERENMLANFGSNSYGIGTSNDQVKFFEAASNGHGHLTYKDFIDMKDKSIERLINGQTATSNDKAFVGSAEVQERTKGEYTKARLKKIQSMINDQLIPFLITEGYPNLKGAKLQFVEIWDDNPKKQATATPPVDPTAPQPPTGQKKKLSSADLHTKLTHIYKVSNCCDHDAPKRVELSSSIDSIFEKAIKNVFDKKIKAGELDPSVWKHNVDEIWKGGLEGFNSGYGDEAQSDDLRKALRRNAGSFAAFKNHANVNEWVDALLDENGNARNWQDFKAKALEINADYNTTWLQTEYNFAQRSATMAVEWERIQADKDILPNLKYVTVGDDRVRPAHEKLDGLIVPIDDPFWSLFYPPNGWGCRCYTEQTDEAIKEPDYTPDETEVPLSMRHNVGKGEKIFSEDHPYFEVSKKEKKSILKQLGDFTSDLTDLFV